MARAALLLPRRHEGPAVPAEGPHDNPHRREALLSHVQNVVKPSLRLVNRNDIC